MDYVMSFESCSLNDLIVLLLIAATFLSKKERSSWKLSFLWESFRGFRWESFRDKFRPKPSS